MSAPRLQLRSVTRRLRSGDAEITVLDRVSLDITPGELVAIVGPSGSGKSTLLALLAGLDRPSEGEILLDETAVHTLSEDALAVLRRKIGFVFQSFQLLPHLTAEENVCLPMELAGTARPRERARELLAQVGLERRGHHYPVQLSGGEQQRVAIARAFGPKPELLLADEPTGNLDRDTGHQILVLLQALHRELGTTTVLVTHDPEVAALASRRIHLRDGQIEHIDNTPVARADSPS